jgi:hypothetical protein
MAQRDRRKIIGYMCGVDWQHELGAAAGGNVVYASADDCRRRRRCTSQCGVVEVEVRLVQWVDPQDFSTEAGFSEPERESPPEDSL